MSREEQKQDHDQEKLNTSEKNRQVPFPLLDKAGSSKAWKAFYASVRDEMDL